MRPGDRAREERRADARERALGPASPQTRSPSAAEAAWLAVLPCAALVLVALLALGPALGRALPQVHLTPFPSAARAFRPEPTEQARYLIATSAPLVLSGLVLLVLRGAPRMRAAAIARSVWALQALGAAFVALCIVVQQRTRFGVLYTSAGTSARTVYFTAATLVVAAAIAAAIVAAAVALARDRRRRERLVAAIQSRHLARVAVAVAVVILAISLLPALNVEDTIIRAAVNSAYHVQFTFDETYAVLDGRSPLVDFAAQYSSLWPYLLAAAMALLGGSVGVYTALTALLTGLAMLALFAVLRRVVRSAVLALALFLPLLATSFFMMNGPAGNRYALVNLFGTMPLRYAGPFLLAWLLARHLDGARPRRRWPLLLAAGLVLLNNGDFGVPALGATLVALLWAERPSVAGARALVLELAAGLAAAFALVSLLTLLRTGSLPHPALLFRFARLFAVAGFGMLPIRPLIGVSTIIFLTYLAAVATATVRAVNRDPDRLLTGLLAWSGVFGLGVGGYYVGRSHPEVLTNMFPAWGFSLTLLVVVTLRGVLARAPRLPSPAQAACLVGFGVLVCSLAQTPTPWSQVQRLGQTGRRAFGVPYEQPFVAAHTRRGEHVAILALRGHRAGANLGVVDVTPYTGVDSMPTREQLRETIDDLHRAGGHKVFVSNHELFAGFPTALRQMGFRLVASERGAGMLEFDG